MKHMDASLHVQGKSLYVDDLPVAEGTLHAAVVASPVARGTWTRTDVEVAMQTEGVVAILTAEDIPGENQIGGIIQDEPLLAEKEIHFAGQPMALVVATTPQIARAAAKQVQLTIDALPAITDPRKACELGHLIQPPRTFSLGNTDEAWKQCTTIVAGRAQSGAQEHLYIETQGAYAYPTDQGGIKVHSSTQGPTAVQKTISRVLGLPMHQVEVDVTRLGGGFGGKEDQASPWAALAALAAAHLQRGVKLILHRLDDMIMTGKRHPYDSDFRIGLDDDLKILAYEAHYYQNAGACADLSTAILERTLFHATNTYFVPHVKVTAHSCRTNLPPNTAFRGFGGPQAMFVMEAAIATAADRLGIPAHAIQEANLLQENDTLPYGQQVKGCAARTCWDEACKAFHWDAVRKQVEAFNASHKRHKRGLALMPICFGISFTNTALNQARALVHIYNDGSVGVSTGAVEMGQGVNTKMIQVAAQTLGISPAHVRMATTNTSRVANTSPTAASAGADLNGKALQLACEQLRGRLLEVAARELNLDSTDALDIRDDQVLQHQLATGLEWTPLVDRAYWSRTCLSQHAHYSTPGIHFDKKEEKGEPFAYHVFGTAIAQATVDILRGTYEIDFLKCVHDFGESMNPLIDQGQAEGAMVQGLGWMTCEEILFDDDGRLMTHALSTYKVPDIHATPRELVVRFLNTRGPDRAIFRSKAIGEPPFMYGIGVYFAIREAIRAARPDADIPFEAPMTPERVLLNLYP